MSSSSSHKYNLMTVVIGTIAVLLLVRTIRQYGIIGRYDEPGDWIGFVAVSRIPDIALLVVMSLATALAMASFMERVIEGALRDHEHQKR